MTRVCVIGAGPSGMAAMYHFGQLGDSAPDVFCYETQTTWGGLWNYTWRTDPLCIEEKIPSLYPDNLYKGIVWLEGSNNKLLYIGAQRAVVSTPMFDI